MRRLHPDYEFLFFSDRDCRRFIRTACPGFLPLWDFYPRGVQRGDFFRILVIYELGGFYFDTDVFFHEPLPLAPDKPLIFPHEWTMAPQGYLHRHRAEAASAEDLEQMGNYAFGAAARHWFLRAVLEEMIRRTGEVDMQDLSDDDVLYSTGPDVLNAVARIHRERLGDELILLRGQNEPRAPVAQSHLGPPSWFQFGPFANHLMSGTWRTSPTW